MPNYTPNLNLEKPLQGEFYNVDVFNANVDKIDTAVGNISVNSYEKPAGGIPLTDVSHQIIDRLDWYGNTSGTANDMVLNIPEFIGTLKPGTVLRFKKTSASTGALRLNFNSNGLKNVLRSNGSAFSANGAGGVYTVVYDGTNFILQGEGGSGNALAAEILSGRTATTDNGEVSGTMPNRGTFNLGLGVTVPPGYYSGGTTADGKLFAFGTIPSNNNGSFYLNDVGFLAKAVILECSYNGVRHRKTFNSYTLIDDYTVTNTAMIYNYGGWSIGPNTVSTNFLSPTAPSGIPIYYKIFS